VAPRFWAALISMPLLTGFFCSLAISAGYFEAVHVIGIDQGFFWQVLKDSVDFHEDFLMAFVKSASSAPPRHWSPRTSASTPNRPSKAPRWRRPRRWSTPRCWC
jgi:hypothetical protein